MTIIAHEKGEFKLKLRIKIWRKKTEYRGAGPFPFACQWGSCLQRFASVSELSSHLDLVDILFKSAIGKWSCQWAGCFRSNHQLVHQFKHRNRLVRPMRSHTGARPYARDTCSKTFNSAAELLRDWLIWSLNFGKKQRIANEKSWCQLKCPRKDSNLLQPSCNLSC